MALLLNLQTGNVPLMRIPRTRIIGIVAITLALPLVTPSVAQAFDPPKPSTSVCTGDAGTEYACMKINAAKVPSGETATFTGSLGAQALKYLKSWTRGDNIVCLTRYKTTPEADGSWPWETLDAACTTVRKNGEFTINAEFGRKGTFYYGLEFGPCRSKKAGECGSGDPYLIGVYNEGDKALKLTTT